MTQEWEPEVGHGMLDTTPDDLGGHPRLAVELCDQEGLGRQATETKPDRKRIVKINRYKEEKPKRYPHKK